MLVCVPRLLFAGLLVVTAAAGTAAVAAVLCMAMTAAMMFMRPGGHSQK